MNSPNKLKKKFTKIIHHDQPWWKLNATYKRLIDDLFSRELKAKNKKKIKCENHRWDFLFALQLD